MRIRAKGILFSEPLLFCDGTIKELFMGRLILIGRIKNRLYVTIILGIINGTICALLDLIPANNIWTFSSFSGYLGFWAITGMMVVMLFEKKWMSAIGTFLYFAAMNSSFFVVHFLISPLFQYPRISELSEAFLQSAIWLIPSALCGICALIAHCAKRDNMLGVIALSLPIGLLIYEFIAVLLSVVTNHKYLFQTVIDAWGIFLLWKMYAGEKNKFRLALVCIAVAGILLGYTFVSDGTILYY